MCEFHGEQEGKVCPICPSATVSSISSDQVWDDAVTASRILIEKNIYNKGRSDGIKEAHAECKKILEALAQDFSNSTIDGRLSTTQETFNNTMFQVITKIKSLIKFHYEH